MRTWLLLSALVLLAVACGSGVLLAEPTAQPKVTIISAVMAPSDRGGNRVKVTIHIRNDSSRTLYGVRLWGDCYSDHRREPRDYRDPTPRVVKSIPC